MDGHAGRILIHEGGACNARVWRVEDGAGGVWIEKDFLKSPSIVRHTLGRFLVWRECSILRRLEKTGAAPGGVRRLTPFSLREDFVAGGTLHDADPGAYALPPAPGEPPRNWMPAVPRAFFEAFEEAVRAVHRTGFVHLDLHNARNVMVAPGWKPVLVDWQSALPTFWMPGFLRRAVERIDLTGVDKLWDKFRPGELPPGRLRTLRQARFIRKYFWLPRLHRSRPRSDSPPPRPPADMGGKEREEGG